MHFQRPIQASPKNAAYGVAGLRRETHKSADEQLHRHTSRRHQNWTTFKSRHRETARSPAGVS
eukprot:scaffold236740_cov35-Tisochrysis_lutea.AAC.2